MQAEASSPHLISVTPTGRFLVVLPRAQVRLLPRSLALRRLLLLLVIAWALLWVPLLFPR